MASPNGMNPNGGPQYVMPPAMLTNAGHHGDMNHVWSLVEELSGLLEMNREQWHELQDKLAVQTQTKADRDSDQAVHESTTDGDKADDDKEAQVTREQMAAELAEADTYIATLEKAHEDQSNLVALYEDGLQYTTARLRDYIYEQQQATLAIHTHYNALLQASRNETLQAQLTHQAWQASFARVAGNLRLALREHGDVVLPYRSRIAALKEENRILRARAGWEPVVEDSDSDDGDGKS